MKVVDMSHLDSSKLTSACHQALRIVSSWSADSWSLWDQDIEV
jgi:hypothetical protein